MNKPHDGRRLLITGGARSGKSVRAETLADARAASGASVTYVATAPAHPEDPEWVARVTEHRARRPATWALVETADVAGALADLGAGDVVLVDCLTLWVTGVVDAADAWEHRETATAAVDRATADLVAALGRTAAEVIVVTNEVGSAIVPDTESGRLFRDLLGRVNIGVAGACDDVELVTCGIAHTLKGSPWTNC